MPQADEISVSSAVQRCLDAYSRARAAAGPDDAVHGPFTLARINRAYRRAMPFLTPHSIDTFLACVTHGLILEVFTPAEAAKLLYATQIANGSRRANLQAAKAEPKSQSNSATLPLHHSATPNTPTPLPTGTKVGEAKGSAPQVHLRGPNPIVYDCP